MTNGVVLAHALAVSEAGSYTAVSEFTQILSPSQWLAMALTILFASMMRAFSGFGFALLAVPVFSQFLTPGDSVVLSASLTWIVTVMSYRSWWGQFPTSGVPTMLLSSLLGTALGAVFLAKVSVDSFRGAIGVVLVMASLLLFRAKPQPRSATFPLATTVGLSSGVMNGAFAIPGPPVILYAMAAITSARESRAFLMMFFLFSNTVSLCAFAALDILSERALLLVPVALPVMLVGDTVGRVLFERVGGVAYRPVAIAVSCVVGLAIVTKAWFQ